MLSMEVNACAAVVSNVHMLRKTNYLLTIITFYQILYKNSCRECQLEEGQAQVEQVQTKGNKISHAASLGSPLAPSQHLQSDS